ncbi:MAG: hypothetical protein LLF98_06800 [Clostridium sp.]|nr:hypothetical protein [Clostridium sp.]MCE5220966.1 hypothetical protein [Clostridium sp.]
MKKFINILTNNKEFNRTVMLTAFLVAVLVVYFFYSSSDLPFVYSQF